MHNWTDTLMEGLAQRFAAAPPPARTGLPRALVAGWQPAMDEEGLVLRREGQELRLDALAAALMLLADGTRPVRHMLDALPALTGAAAEAETAFATLDALADAGLLEARVSPPGSETTALATGRPGRVESLRPEGAASAPGEALPAEHLGPREEGRKKRPAKPREKDAKTLGVSRQQAPAGHQQAPARPLAEPALDAREQSGKLDREEARKTLPGAAPSSRALARDTQPKKTREQDKKQEPGIKRKGG